MIMMTMVVKDDEHYVHDVHDDDDVSDDMVLIFLSFFYSILLIATENKKPRISYISKQMILIEHQLQPSTTPAAAPAIFIRYTLIISNIFNILFHAMISKQVDE